MARPIAETPILTGEDAIRFERLRKEVDSLTKEERAENTRKLEERIKNAKIQISIRIQSMELVKLTPSHDLSQFDCGDTDLNEFLRDNALNFTEKRIANTYVLEDNGRIAAYFCLLNDKVSQQESSNNKWKKLKKGFPEGKQFSSYPAIKIGRFAVSSSYRGLNLGTILMDKIKKMLNGDSYYSAFRYLTVDAYLSAIGFYEKNKFKVLSSQTVDEHTRLMFFDMMELC